MVDIETATNQMIGQLNGMSDRIEKFVDEEDFEEFCDASATMITILKKARRQARQDDKKQDG